MKKYRFLAFLPFIISILLFGCKGNSEKFAGGHPLNANLVTDLKSNFEISYLTPFIINETGGYISINPNIKTIDSLKIPTSIVLNYAMIDTPYQKTDGVAIFYILDTIPVTHELYYTYAITPAVYDTMGTNNRIIPTPQKSGKIQYLVPNYLSGYRVIETTEFNNLRSLYNSTVHIRELNGNKVYRVDSFNYYFKNLHPTNVFYAEKEIYYFHDDNSSAAPNPSKFYLKLEHGAIFCKQYDSASVRRDFKVQTPILSFEYDKQHMVDGDEFIRGTPYKNKAMDVGRMCPPECN